VEQTLDEKRLPLVFYQDQELQRPNHNVRFLATYFPVDAQRFILITIFKRRAWAFFFFFLFFFFFFCPFQIFKVPNFFFFFSLWLG